MNVSDTQVKIFQPTSLRAHTTDILNPVLQNCNVVVFHETWLGEESKSVYRNSTASSSVKEFMFGLEESLSTTTKMIL